MTEFLEKVLTDSWVGHEPIVYGLHSDDGQIVYVGATRNPRLRFAAYRSRSECHNPKLGDWLKSHPVVFVKILHRGIDGMFNAERREIASRPNLFNLIGGGDQAWREYETKPWAAGTGILCPSAMVLQRLAKAGHPCHSTFKTISDARRAGMDNFERVMYEVKIAQSLPMTAPLKRWLENTTIKMINVLEGQDASQST